MNSKRFAQLASQAQAGDEAALEQLLLLAYTPVSYQCRKLLQNDQAAKDMTKEILQRIPTQLHSLNNPELFEKWLGNLTAKHCMRMLRQQTAEKTTLTKKPDIPGDYLDKRETAMVVDQIVDTLPENSRICITLYCCCAIPVNGIAKLTGFAESDIKAHLSRAQALINGQLKKLSQQGVRFAAVTSIPELLQIVMDTPRNPRAASAMVGSILGKQAAAAPVPTRQKKTVPVLTIAVVVTSVLLMLMLVLIFFLERDRQAVLATEDTTVTTEVTTLPTETILSTTTAATTVETTIETTVETTAETTGETTEATTEPATEPAPKVQQSQGSQTASGGSTSASTGTNASSTTNGNTSSGTGSNTTSASGGNASSAGGNHTHSYQDAGPIGTTPAGCESAGWRTKICFVCGDKVKYQDPSTLPPVGHNYSSKVKEPTTGREGFTIHTCTRCGDTYMDNYVPKLPAETQPPATQAPPAPQPEESPAAEPEASPET